MLYSTALISHFAKDHSPHSALLKGAQLQRTIYHGSPQIVRTPRFGTGPSYNDYGLGFYCTESPSLAGEWAAGMSSDGFINTYSIETDGLRVINLNSPEYCILHWLATLLSFRVFDADSSATYQAKEYIRSAFGADYQNCDCIIGFRADNCNFWFAQSFLNGEISYRELNEAVRLSDTGRQFVLKSNRAFDRVLFNGYTIAGSSTYYPAAMARERKAVAAFTGRLSSAGSRLRSGKTAAKSDTSRSSGDIFVSDIVNERIQSYDSRLIY